MIKVILFDFDDTLVKTFETKAVALIETGKIHYDLEITIDEVKKHWGKPFKQFVTDLYQGIDNTELIIEKLNIERLKFPTSTYNNTIAVLNKLSDKYLLGIISSVTERYVKDDMKIANIPEKLFFIIQTEEHTKVHKPNPHVFDFILEQLGTKKIKKSEILYVGDRLNDFYAARDAGFQFYGIPDRTTPKKDFIQAGANIVNDISDLLKKL